ncbi:protein MICROTUBULE BINDING PROTEIN 2C-like [Trifolium pratense]|nr:protein MICROTUBULE BINDING PROTEIN 2C-like [Trifolium pratense]
MQHSNLADDSDSWLSTAAASSAPNSNLNRDLFNDLVQIVPLVQSLIDSKATRSSFTRRGSIIYTKTPARESLFKKAVDSKGRNVAQSIPDTKIRDEGAKEQAKNGNNNSDADDSFSMFSGRAFASEKDAEELATLKEKMEELQLKLREKEELLKSAENLRDQMNAASAKLDEMKHQVSEKDGSLKYTQQQLSDAKIKLADKQAALEKIHWELMTSNKKVEKLQEELDSVQTDISSFTLLLEGLAKTDTAKYSDDYDTKPYVFNHAPDIDNMDEVECQKIEEARKAYIAAVVVCKEKRDEESIAAAANTRLQLQSLLFKSKNANL